MRFFLYEYITGGGLLPDPKPPSGSLLAEGTAMISAMADDFARLGEVIVMLDDRLDSFFDREVRVVRVRDPREEQATFSRLASKADWTLVIAPEFDTLLFDRVGAARIVCKQLLNCSPQAIQIASDKQQTAELLAASGVPVPIGQAIHAREPLPRELLFPAIVKPIDGAGSQDVRYIATPEDLLAMRFGHRSWRLERYCQGTPASCAVLCGSVHRVALPACSQRLADEPSFAYLGGSAPLDTRLDQRARALALRAVAALPEPLGYVGVDLVLGQMPDGTGDVVIEINPRLTTSYVGLRQLVKTNLAVAMLDVARGNEPAISWYDGSVEFLADGTILHSHTIVA